MVRAEVSNTCASWSQYACVAPRFWFMFLHFCSVQIAHAVMHTSSHTAYRIHMNSCNVTRSLDWTMRVGNPWQSTLHFHHVMCLCTEISEFVRSFYIAYTMRSSRKPDAHLESDLLRVVYNNKKTNNECSVVMRAPSSCKRRVLRDFHLSTSMCIQIHMRIREQICACRMQRSASWSNTLCWKLCFWCGSPWFQQRLRFGIYILWAANHSEKYQDSACRHWDAFGWAVWTALLLLTGVAHSAFTIVLQ